MFTTIFVWAIQFVSIYAIIFWLLVYLDKGAKDQNIKELKKFPLVSITVPAYNEEKTIKETIYSLLNLDYPKEKLELFVVNDCSTDNTKKIVKELIKKHKNITLINNKVNIGKAAGLNKALNLSKGEFFICLDADSFIEKKALKYMLPYFEDKEVGSVVPRIYIRNTSKFILKFQWVEYIITFFFKKLMGHLDCIHVTPGPFSIYRTKLTKKLGGFDEGNITEDLEMALRLQKNNYKIIQVLETAASTIAPSNLYGFYRQRNRWLKGSLLNLIKYKNLFFNKKYSEFGFFQLPMVLFASFASITIAFFILYQKILQPLIKVIRTSPGIVYQIDIPYHIKNIISNFYISDLFSFNKFLFLYILIALGFVFLVCAFKTSEISIRQKGILPVAFYLFLYPILVAFIWMGVLVDLARNKVKW